MNSRNKTALVQNITEEFENRFSQSPLLIQSPGRVNLIGDHTDYNDGFVLPATIQQMIVLAIKENDLDKIRMYSVDMNQSVELNLNNLQPIEKHWANYIKGTVSEVQNAGYQPRGFDVVFGGDIPIGAGLSSSAALEGGVLLGMDRLFEFCMSRKQMAKLGQLTEHNHVGVRCGIMDQFINLHGQKDKVLKLDCRSLEYELYPFKRKDIKIVLCNSMVSHNLASSEYNVRRIQCEEGVNTLKKYQPETRNLRDVNLELLEEHKEELGSVVYRRCKFVISENQRVNDACDDLTKGDFKSFGQRMFQSHHGLSNEYEVSCDELDVLVEIAGDLPGVLGSRMMGGGFGGCTINLVKEEHVEKFTESISREYKKKTGLDTEIYITQINEGAKVLEV